MIDRFVVLLALQLIIDRFVVLLDVSPAADGGRNRAPSSSSVVVRSFVRVELGPVESGRVAPPSRARASLIPRARARDASPIASRIDRHTHIAFGRRRRALTRASSTSIDRPRSGVSPSHVVASNRARASVRPSRGAVRSIRGSFVRRFEREEASVRTRARRAGASSSSTGGARDDGGDDERRPGDAFGGGFTHRAGTDR